MESSPSVQVTDAPSFTEESLQFFRSLLSGRRTKNKAWSLSDVTTSTGGPPTTDLSSSSSSTQARRNTSLSKMFQRSASYHTSASRGGGGGDKKGSSFVCQRARQATAAPAIGQEKPSTPPLWLPLVDYLCRVVEQHGMNKIGIFRISGNARMADELMQTCSSIVSKKPDGEEAMEKALQSWVENDEVHIIATVLKAYLREQQEPLLPGKLYDAFLAAGEVEDLQAKLKQFKSLLNQMEDDHRMILARVIQTLVSISKNSTENKMDASNLAIVFGPSLLRAEAAGLDIIFKIKAQCLVIENFILHYSTLFLDQELEVQNAIKEERISPREDNSSDDDDVSPERLAQEMEEAEKEAIDTVLDTIAQELQDAPAELQLMEHKFKREKFNPFSPTMCKCCRKFIFGIRKAYMCKNCSYPVHGKCRKKAGNSCPGKSDATTTREVRGVQVGDKAPLFTLPDGENKPYSLEESIRMGKKIVLFFYPKDFTPGCVRENKAFRDQFSLFHYADCEIVGISGDSSSCHARFAAKYNIPFRLLSDSDGKIRELFGVPDSVGGLAPGRVTYIIDPTGTIVHLYNSMFNPKEHLVHSLLAISQMLLQDQGIEPDSTLISA